MPKKRNAIKKQKQNIKRITSDRAIKNIAQQLKALEAEANKEHTPTEARKYLIKLCSTMTSVATVWDQLITFPDSDPIGRKLEQDALEGIPGAFNEMLEEARHIVLYTL